MCCCSTVMRNSHFAKYKEPFLRVKQFNVQKARNAHEQIAGGYCRLTRCFPRNYTYLWGSHTWSTVYSAVSYEKQFDLAVSFDIHLRMLIGHYSSCNLCRQNDKMDYLLSVSVWLGRGRIFRRGLNRHHSLTVCLTSVQWTVYTFALIGVPNEAICSISTMKTNYIHIKCRCW